MTKCSLYITPATRLCTGEGALRVPQHMQKREAWPATAFTVTRVEKQIHPEERWRIWLFLLPGQALHPPGNQNTAVSGWPVHCPSVCG